MTLGEIIKEYRNEHHMSMDEFARRIGKSKQYISVLEKNLNPSTGKPPKPTLEVIASVASVVGETLDGILLKLDSNTTISLSTVSGLMELPSTTRRPRLGAIACGDPITAEQNIEGYDEVPDYIKCDFTLVCRGDSMTGARIFDGDLVCIRQQPTVESGQIAAVLVDGEATLKRVRFLDDGIILLPENPAYPPMVYTGDAARNVRIIGLATHFISTVK